MEAFLGLFDNVPPFFHSPPKGVNLTGGTALALRSSFNLEKTAHSECNQPWKTFDYLQCIVFSKPMVYKTLTAVESSS